MGLSVEHVSPVPAPIYTSAEERRTTAAAPAAAETYGPPKDAALSHCHRLIVQLMWKSPGILGLLKEKEKENYTGYFISQNDSINYREHTNWEMETKWCQICSLVVAGSIAPI